mgnify:CR=1 FL=1
MVSHGIDVSHHQGCIDFEAVKNSGKVDFAILKAGGSDDGFYEDSKFREYLDGFRNVGISILGAYYFVGSGCVSTEDGIADADRLCDILDGTGITYAILDLESTNPDDRDGATDASIGFMDRCIERGYKTMIYASDISGFQNRLDIDRLEGYKKWVARYGSEPQYVSNYVIWQYSSTENIDGIPDNTVDCNYLYDEEVIAELGITNDNDITTDDDTTTSGVWTHEQSEKVISGMYEGLLLRGYSSGENDSLVNMLATEWTRVQTFDDLRASDEYKKKHLIIDCYMVMRGSVPSDEELNDWMQQDEDTIKNGILYSDEFNNKYNV